NRSCRPTGTASGAVAERLRSGLQIRVPRFESGRRLQIDSPVGWCQPGFFIVRTFRSSLTQCRLQDEAALTGGQALQPTLASDILPSAFRTLHAQSALLLASPSESAPPRKRSRPESKAIPCNSANSPSPNPCNARSRI